MFDVFVEVGGSTVAREVFIAHVVDGDGAASIDRRDLAAADVDALLDRSSPWDLPVGIRNRLERWELDDVAEAVVAADLVLQQRAALESIEASVGVDEPDRADEAYASAPMSAAGGVDFSEATTILDNAIRLGAQLEEIVSAIDSLEAAAGVTPPELSSLADVDDFASGVDAAEGQLTALRWIIDIDERLDAVSGFAATVGRWGSDIGSDVDEARAQVEQGDTEAALATLASADERIDDLAAAGVVRLVIAGGVVLALLVAVALIMRRGRSAEVDAQTTTEAGPATL
jgi:hypothetical protein